MLSRLSIQNYAIIDVLDIAFTDKLNIITGETGAGKSILIGAFGLVLGDRADTTVLLDKEKKCIVEALFDGHEIDGIKAFLVENDLDEAKDITVRREILPSGKSRAFINDTPANVNQLKILGSMLADLHQQFDTLELGEADFQRKVVDALADNAVLLASMQKKFAHYTAEKRRLNELVEKQQAANKELDYNRFLFEELEEASLKENELEDAESALKLLSNAEAIKTQLNSVYYELRESNEPIVQKLKTLQNRLQDLVKYQPTLEALIHRLQSAQVELDDIAEEVETTNDAVVYSTEKIESLSAKLDIGYRLLKKHGVQTTNELLAIQQQLSEKLVSIANLSDEIKATENSVNALHAECTGIAEKISAKRLKQIPSFESKVKELLTQVGMPNARLKINISAGAISGDGSDEINFLFDSNATGRFEPLSKVASGGELSRLMLVIKSLVASKLQLPTMIFDEIDSGISGEAARQVANIMKGLSSSHQLIVISHQPQIAAKAYAHYFVFKEAKNGSVSTSVKLLTDEERVVKVAQMMGGDSPSATALKNAKEMIADSLN